MKLDELNHTYTKDGERYQSVSELIRRYKKPFHAELIAQKVADKTGRAIGDVLEEWELKKELAIDFGNAIHKAIELYINFGEKPKHKVLLKVVKEFAKLAENKELYSEINVSSDKLKIAGTIDLLESVGKKKVKILDIKTNGDLYKESKSYFLPPFANIRDSKINEYRLQLTAYKYLLELKGLSVEALELWHYDNQFNIIELDPIDNIEKLWEKKI